MTLKLLAIAVLLMLPTQVRADEPSAVENVSVIDFMWDGLHKMPNFRSGGIFDYTHERVLNTLGVSVVDGGYFGKFWNNVSLDANYAGQDGIGGALNVDLRILPIEDIPVLKLVRYGYLGYGGGIRSITDDVFKRHNKNPESDNQTFTGPTFGFRINY